MPLKVGHEMELSLETVPVSQSYGRTVLPYTVLYTNHNRTDPNSKIP